MEPHSTLATLTSHIPIEKNHSFNLKNMRFCNIRSYKVTGVAMTVLKDDAAAPDLIGRDLQWFEEQYDRRSRANYFFHHAATWLILLLSTLIPLLSASGIADATVKWYMAALGAAIAILQGSKQIFNWHELWIAYRSAREAIRREKFLFNNDGGYYSGTDEGSKRGLFAQKVFDVLEAESKAWVITRSKVYEQAPRNLEQKIPELDQNQPGKEPVQ